MIHYINLLKESVLFNILVSFTVIFFKTFYYSHPSLIFCFKNYLNFKPFLKNDDLFFKGDLARTYDKTNIKTCCTTAVNVNMYRQHQYQYGSRK